MVPELAAAASAAGAGAELGRDRLRPVHRPSLRRLAGRRAGALRRRDVRSRRLPDLDRRWRRSLVGVVEFFVALELTPALLLFAALVVAFVFVGRRVYGSLDSGAPQLPLSRAHALIGKEFYLDEAIERGYGRIRVGDSVWRVAGDDLPDGREGARRRRRGRRGSRVEKA